MLDSKGVSDYWEEQTEKGDNPCHYHNKWQDRYAFRIRTGGFRKSDFDGATSIVDLGCGIGEYAHEIAKLTSARIDGFDFPFNIAIAEKTYPNHPQLSFHPYPVPHESIREAVKSADVVYTTTVYVHFSEEARAAFYSYITNMKEGGRVMLLEYIPEEVPAFQKNLPYKSVETASEIEARFKEVGFTLGEMRHLNFIDSFLFFHLGKSAFTYFLTMTLERFLSFVGYTRSKYKLLIFVKERP